jgi:hypothetical protein
MSIHIDLNISYRRIEQMDENKQFWRITEFSQMIGKSINTVDGWFKRLEDNRVHYVQRTGNEKVYDEMDLQIAHFISAQREKRWSLDAIFTEIVDRFDLRPFPLEQEATDKPQLIDVGLLRQQIINEMKQSFEQIAITMLPKPVDELEERQKRITDIITVERVKSKLEREALEQWSQKSAEERMIKVGWFRSAEDTTKRDLFVKDYVSKYFEQRLNQEYDPL